MSKKLVLVADFHEGHRVGLTNPSWAPTGDAGAKVREAIFEKYYWSAVESEWHAPDVLAIVGDAIDGKGKRQTGVGQWDTSIQNQAIRAAKLAAMWDAKEYIVIRGSGYHVETGGEPGEELMARELGAMVFPHQEHVEPELRERSGWHCYLTIEGVSFHLAHAMPVSKVFHYRGTPITREMMYTRLNDALLKVAGKYKTKVTVRAHCHFFWVSQSARTMGIVLPAWQGLTPFMMAKSPTAISPDIGFVGFELEDGEILRRHDQLWPVEFIQKPPHFIISEKGGE